jgi:hypothetical protein
MEKCAGFICLSDGPIVVLSTSIMKNTSVKLSHLSMLR